MRTRVRSNAIDATSFDEFVLKAKQPSAYKEESPNLLYNDSDDEFEDLVIYKLNKSPKAEKPLDIEIEDEEEELNNKINEMNLKYNKKSRKEAIDSESSIKVNCSTTDSLSDLKKDALFVSQNLSIEAKTLKYLVIGDKATGKTTLLNAFTDNKTSKYYPTKRYVKRLFILIKYSLEIKKSIYSYSQSEKVKLEFWDTSRQIIDSKMIQTYMKIANGFIFVCNIANRESVEFIKEQIETVLNYSSKQNHQNMHFYVNLSSASNNVFKTNLELFSSIAEHYHVEPKRINCIDLMNYFPLEDSLFKEFIKSTIKGLN